MSDTIYVYQIMGILEHPQTRKLGGLRVMVCNAHVFEQVDVPADCMGKELVAYLRFRSLVCTHFDVRRLPNSILNELRSSVGKWLDDFMAKKLV